MIYALFIKSNKYINTQCKLMYVFLICEDVYLNLILFRTFRKSFSKNKCFHIKNINYNVHKLNGNFLHIQMQNTFEKKVPLFSSPLD